MVVQVQAETAQTMDTAPSFMPCRTAMSEMLPACQYRLMNMDRWHILPRLRCIFTYIHNICAGISHNFRAMIPCCRHCRIEQQDCHPFLDGSPVLLDNFALAERNYSDKISRMIRAVMPQMACPCQCHTGSSTRPDAHG